jgi:hypothetical protein
VSSASEVGDGQKRMMAHLGWNGAWMMVRKS